LSRFGVVCCNDHRNFFVELPAVVVVVGYGRLPFKALVLQSFKAARQYFPMVIWNVESKKITESEKIAF
jgi:hypothetical protein